jgi:hypothetical protein
MAEGRVSWFLMASRLTGLTHPVGLASTPVAALGTFVNFGLWDSGPWTLPQRHATWRVAIREVVGDGKILRSYPESLRMMVVVEEAQAEPCLEGLNPETTLVPVTIR